MKIDLQETYRAPYSSSFTKILLKNCNCYRSISAHDDGRGKAIKSPVMFNKQRVNGSFCSIVSEISTIIFSYNYFIAGISHLYENKIKTIFQFRKLKPEEIIKKSFRLHILKEFLKGEKLLVLLLR